MAYNEIENEHVVIVIGTAQLCKWGCGHTIRRVWVPETNKNFVIEDVEDPETAVRLVRHDCPAFHRGDGVRHDLDKAV